MSTLATIALRAATHIRDDFGPIGGPVAYVGFLVAWVVCGLPSTPIEMIPGFLFGITIGATVTTTGKMIGSVISLLIGRYLMKDRITRLLTLKYPRILRLTRAIEREGFPVVLLLRSAPLPMFVKNYGLAVMDTSLTQSLLAGFITSVPHSLAWAYLGNGASSLAQVVEGGGSVLDVLPDKKLVALVGVPLVVMGFMVSLRVKKRFDELTKEE